jgi:hypothetical protein
MIGFRMTWLEAETEAEREAVRDAGHELVRVAEEAGLLLDRSDWSEEHDLAQIKAYTERMRRLYVEMRLALGVPLPRTRLPGCSVTHDQDPGLSALRRMIGAGETVPEHVWGSAYRQMTRGGRP